MAFIILFVCSYVLGEVTVYIHVVLCCIMLYYVVVLLPDLHPNLLPKLEVEYVTGSS